MNKVALFSMSAANLCKFEAQNYKKMGKYRVGGNKKMGCRCKFFLWVSDFVKCSLCYLFVIVENKKCTESSVHFIPRVYRWRLCFASYSQTAWQESATQQVAHVSALQHESTTQQVSACSHVASLHFLLLQHELTVRAATATITNNTFFIFVLILSLLSKKSGAKLQYFSDTLCLKW